MVGCALMVRRLPATLTMVLTGAAPGTLAVMRIAREVGSPPVPSFSVTSPCALVTRLVSDRLPESALSITVTPDITVLLASRTSAITLTSLPAVPTEASVPESVVRLRVGTALITSTVISADLAEPALAVMVILRRLVSPLVLSFSVT